MAEFDPYLTMRQPGMFEVESWPRVAFSGLTTLVAERAYFAALFLGPRIAPNDFWAL